MFILEHKLILHQIKNTSIIMDQFIYYFGYTTQSLCLTNQPTKPKTNHQWRSCRSSNMFDTRTCWNILMQIQDFFFKYANCMEKQMSTVVLKH